MDHKLATDSMAVEKYLLGELNADERTIFEKHAFDCDECAAAIRNGIAFLDNGGVLVEGERRFRWGRVVTWFPTAVAAALAVVVGVQNIVTIPAMRLTTQAPAIQVVPMYRADQARGAENEHPAAGKQSLIIVDIASEQTFASYRCELRNASGRVLASQPVTRQQAMQPVPVLLSPLPAGSYILAIEGVREDGNRTPIASNQVNVEGP